MPVLPRQPPSGRRHGAVVPASQPDESYLAAAAAGGRLEPRQAERQMGDACWLGWRELVPETVRAERGRNLYPRLCYASVLVASFDAAARDREDDAAAASRRRRGPRRVVAVTLGDANAVPPPIESGGDAMVTYGSSPGAPDSGRKAG
ncbi:hypothetical protein CDD83_290 [Cordyceps sp. RAO-2017]|nr:hypothetical protein CDD83_290 [Cordyceps sp. RAO-2017]